MEATVGIEPTIGVLQTPALTTWPRRHECYFWRLQAKCERRAPAMCGPADSVYPQKYPQDPQKNGEAPTEAGASVVSLAVRRIALPLPAGAGQTITRIYFDVDLGAAKRRREGD